MLLAYPTRSTDVFFFFHWQGMWGPKIWQTSAQRDTFSLPKNGQLWAGCLDVTCREVPVLTRRSNARESDRLKVKNIWNRQEPVLWRIPAIFDFPFLLHFISDFPKNIIICSCHGKITSISSDGHSRLHDWYFSPHCPAENTITWKNTMLMLAALHLRLPESDIYGFPMVMSHL